MLKFQLYTMNFAMQLYLSTVIKVLSLKISEIFSTTIFLDAIHVGFRIYLCCILDKSGLTYCPLKIC